jgi:hypothetical protein
MNSLEILLMLVFVVTLYMVIVNKLPSELIAGGTALWFTVLWIGFDNMKMWNIPNTTVVVDYCSDTLENCGIIKPKSEKRKKIEKKVIFDKMTKAVNGGSDTKTQETSGSDNNDSDADSDVDDSGAENNNDNIDMDKQIKEKMDKTMKKTKDDSKKETNPKHLVIQQPKQLKYSEDNYKYNLFDEIGCDGDNMIAHKMKQMSNKNREAMDNFSRTFTKYSNVNYFDQELKDAEASRWWDNQDLEGEF